jgi:AraC-like DNA-binding protein
VSGKRIESHTFEPAEGLRDVVATYWVTRWDLRGQPPHLTELISDPCVNVAFEAGRSRVVGVATKLFRRELGGTGSIRAVKLRAGAARALFAIDSVASLSERIVPLGELVGEDVEALEQHILSPADDQEALARLEAWVAGRMQVERDPKIGLAVQVVERVARDAEMRTAADVVRVSGISLRPLQRLFRDYVGASPKWVIRRFRLQEAAVRLERGGFDSLAELAAALGYADHAHLSRDFKAVTGRSPAEFARGVWK